MGFVQKNSKINNLPLMKFVLFEALPVPGLEVLRTKLYFSGTFPSRDREWTRVIMK
jgi:hypothetical protein